MKLFEKSLFLRSIEENAVGKPLILYGVGMDAVWAIEDWCRHFGKPFHGCICDRNPQAQKFKIDAVDVLSPDSAFARYPDAYIWVAAKNFKFEIIGYLLYEKKIPANRILNFEPVLFKKGCRYAEKMFFAFEGFDENKALNRQIHICDNIRKTPTLQFTGYDTLCDEFCRFRDRVTEELALGVDNGTCFHCANVKESYFAATKKIRTYNLATDGRCNFRCSYCDAPIFSEKKVEKVFDFARAFELFSKHDMLSPDLHVDITSGEICVNPYREQMLEVTARYAETVSIATNASIFNQQIYELLKSGRASLIVSLDAGTKETFATIKNRDFFEKVQNNLRQYRQAGAGAVEPKYIFLPGTNDNPRDIDGFIDFCKEIRPMIITLSFDFYHKEKVQQHTLEMIQRLKDGLSAQGLYYKYEARVAHILKLSDEVI